MDFSRLDEAVAPLREREFRGKILTVGKKKTSQQRKSFQGSLFLHAVISVKKCLVFLCLHLKQLFIRWRFVLKQTGKSVTSRLQVQLDSGSGCHANNYLIRVFLRVDATSLFTFRMQHPWGSPKSNG